MEVANSRQEFVRRELGQINGERVEILYMSVDQPVFYWEGLLRGVPIECVRWCQWS